jgi:hypothetical protein
VFSTDAFSTFATFWHFFAGRLALSAGSSLLASCRILEPVSVSSPNNFHHRCNIGIAGLFPAISIGRRRALLAMTVGNAEAYRRDGQN